VAPLHRTARPGHPLPRAARPVRAAVVADLRAATARCPADAGLLSPITDLRHAGTAFAALWETGIVGLHETDTKTVDHPDAGTLTLDCDVLIAPGTDLRVVACTAAPGSGGTSSGSSASSAPRP
jgi:hypothetical protein